jgi:hypothetical protein
MKNVIRKVQFVPILFLLTSCIFESQVPIDQPNIPTDDKLLFSWKEQNSNDVYKVKKLNNVSYKIEMYSEQSKKTSILAAHSSMVDGEHFLNIRELGTENSRKKYMLVKMEWISDVSFKIYPLNENTNEQFSTSEELRNFIIRNRRDSSFYGQPGIFIKLK